MGKADFGITLDEPNYIAGSSVKGQIWAEIKKEISGTDFQGVSKLTFSWTSTVWAGG